MNAVSYAMNKIKHSIPREILFLLFKQENAQFSNSFWDTNINNTKESVESLIKKNVIYDRVNVDCNLVGANEVIIPLDDVPYKTVQTGERIYKIPDEYLGGKAIVSALSLYNITGHHYTITGSEQFSGNGGGILSRMDRLYKNLGKIPKVTNADTAVINDTTVAANVGYGMHNRLAIMVLLGGDVDMSHLKGKALPVYSNLVVLATKAYIYNQLVIDINGGVMINGINNSKIQEIVDNYSDANQSYDEYYNENWGVTVMTNDSKRMMRYVNSMTSKSV